jgi:DNA-binding transcriptional ArsR family regulator
MAPVVKITLDAETFKALASSTRLTVLRALDQRRKTLTELARDLNLNKATVHEHLQLLTAADLVRKRDDEGRKWIYYELTWRGEKILHPQETTTFNLLLGISMAAAGGGAGMLALAIHRWAQERPMQAVQEPVGSEALERGIRVGTSSDLPPGEPMAVQADSSTTGSARTETGASGTGSSSPPSGEQTESGGTGSPTSAQPAGAGGGQAGGEAGLHYFYDRDGNATADQFAALRQDEPPAAPASDPPFALDEQGWLGLALAGLGVLSATLATLMWRKLRPKRFVPPAGVDPAEDRSL